MALRNGQLREMHLFAGAGGGILGSLLSGHEIVCACEADPYCINVLLQRQIDGMLPRFPIWNDVRTLHGREWSRCVDIISGGFPCQDISSAGTGSGISGKSSGLWREFARLIGEVRPRFVLIENSSMLRIRGLDLVLCDLASLGYDAVWQCLQARDCLAPHKRRERMWILAYANSVWQQELSRGVGESWLGTPKFHRDILHAMRSRLQTACRGEAINRTTWWQTEPGLDRLADGVADWVERIKALGNGQIPNMARQAWSELCVT